jgi:hypothetical protein
VKKRSDPMRTMRKDLRDTPLEKKLEMLKEMHQGKLPANLAALYDMLELNKQ